MYKFLLFSTIISLSLSINAQDSSDKPCNSPKAREFDFWIGEWKVEWKDSAGEKSYGTNTIDVMWDGCVIRESFDGKPGSPLIGNSYSVYIPSKNKWYQTWVDNYGSYLAFEGEFKDNKMIMTTERIEKDGKKVHMRMVWHNIKENELDWNWERSDDNGNNWQSKWIIHYTRK